MGRWAEVVRPAAVSVIVPLLVERATGAPYLTTAAWLRRFYTWPDERREAWRAQRLEAILDHARRAVPHYRGLPASGAPMERLARLPLVTKQEIREDPERFRSAGWREMDWIAKRTGGTSGEPMQYELDKAAWTQMYAASLHLWERTGYRYGERIVLAGAPPSLHPESNDWRTRARLLLENRCVATTGVAVDPATSLERARIAGRADAALWYGYASAFNAMAHAVEAAGERIEGPRAIVSTSEPLRPEWRAAIERVFGSPVYDQYGCNDGGVLAQSCARGRYHLADNLSVVEVVDGDRACPPGEEGDLVVTNLHARVLPFLRYRIDDRAALADGPCPCGTRGRTLERVSGRTGDLVELPDGRRLAMPALTHAFWDARGVRAWQLVQDRPGHLRVRIDPSPAFGPDDLAAVETGLRRQCGREIEIEITTGEPLEQEPNGKYKVVIRRFTSSPEATP